MVVNFDKVISAAEAAEIIGVTPVRVCVFAKDGRIRAKRVGRDWVFDKDDVIRFAKEDRPQGRPPKAD